MGCPTFYEAGSNAAAAGAGAAGAAAGALLGRASGITAGLPSPRLIALICSACSD